MTNELLNKLAINPGEPDRPLNPEDRAALAELADIYDRLARELDGNACSCLVAVSVRDVVAIEHMIERVNRFADDATHRIDRCRVSLSPKG